MAIVAQGGFFALNGIDLSSLLRKVGVKASADTPDSTTIGDTVAKKFMKSLYTLDVTGEGFFRASATTADDANGLLNGAVTATSGNYLALFAREGATAGYPAEMMNLTHAEYSIDQVVGDLLMASFNGKMTATSSAAVYQIGLVLINQTFTGAANGTSYDNSGATTGWVVQGHVTAGDGSVTLKLQHSSNNSTWADLYNIGAVTQNTAFTYSSTSDSVNRYLRVIATAIGGTTATAVVAVKTGYTG